MRGRTTLSIALATFALGGHAWGEAPTDYERGEKLAWHIEAYAPCDHGAGIGAIKEEVSAFEATRNETLIALDIIEHDANACSSLKSTSGKLLILAQNEPAKFDLAFGFTEPLIVELAATEADDKVNANAKGPGEKKLSAPPDAATLKTRSSY